MAEYFAGFTGRDDALSRIKRYDDRDAEGRFDVMYHRTDDLIHSRRTASIVKALSPFASSEHNGSFDPLYAFVLAHVHDDPEIVTGDVMHYVKRAMSSEEKRRLEWEETKAICELGMRWPDRVAGFDYRMLLFDAQGKHTLESHVMKIADWVDGFCEAFHEVLAGNERFVIPSNENIEGLLSLPGSFSDVRCVYEAKPALLEVPDGFDASAYLGARKHSRESVSEPVGVGVYDEWVKITLDNFESDVLIVQKEFEKESIGGKK